MFTQRHRDRPDGPSYLLDCRTKNVHLEANHTPLRKIQEAIVLIASEPVWLPIDLQDGYHNIGI